MFQKKWLALRPGDSIQMIAPGMPFEWANVRASEKLLANWGYRLEYPAKLLGRHPVSANSRELRESFLKAALNSDSKIIWAARGGYGSLHLLRSLQKMKKPRVPKLLIGFSDITTLHQFFNQEWGWATLHGPHVDRLSHLNPARLKELRQIISGEKTEIVFKNMKPLNSRADRPQVLRAPIVGGNLITLQSTFGTRWQMDTAGKIIFLEDLGERGYKLDRVLEHMDLLGMFDKARGLIFGPFMAGLEPDGSSKLMPVMKDFANRLKLPVFQGVASGHIPNSSSLPLQTTGVLAMREGRGSLVVSTGCES